jgi:tripartite-type tricarboxylate transporter receptor subunit TctC
VKRSFSSTVIAMMLLSLFWLSAAAFAQMDYPVRPIRLLVGFPGGTAPDIGARVLGDKLEGH